MIWYFISVYIHVINRMLHGRLENIFQHFFVSPHGHVISSILYRYIEVQVAFSLAYNLVPLMSLQVDKAVYNETLLFPLHKRNKSLVSVVTLYYTAVLRIDLWWIIKFYCFC